MSGMKKYEAIVDFKLNTPSKEDGTSIRAGEEFEYNGLKVIYETSEGEKKEIKAPMLKSTEGEWYKELK